MNKKGFCGSKNTFVRTLLTAALLLCGGTAMAQVQVKGNVFGGGNLANVGGSSSVTINQNGATIGTLEGEAGSQTLKANTGDVYGGGAKALVNTKAGATDTTGVIISKGSILGNVYGGGLGFKASEGSGLSDTAANVFGAVTVNINNGATVDSSVFGCNNVFGAPQSTVVVNINGGLVNKDVFGGGNLATATVIPVVNISGGEVKQSVFGGGNKAGVAGDTVNISGGTVCSAGDSLYGIYGGCNEQGTVTGDIIVNITSNVGASDKRLTGVYGGGLGQPTQTTGNVTVNIATSGAASGPTIYGDLYGGSALGQVSASDDTTTVNFYNGTLNGTLYGGGMGDNSTSAEVTGAVEVAIANGAITGGVYGGCNLNGVVKKDITVDITNGTVGDSTAFVSSPQTKASVFGGGLGHQTSTNGNVKVNINGDNVVVWGDVYGGSGYGNVNDTSTDKTTVNLLDGKVKGDVYGGGLGDKAKNYAAQVNGVVEVNIGAAPVTPSTEYTGNATIGGNVFGCNNAYGTPKADVNVNVYKTAHNGTNNCPSVTNLETFNALTNNAAQYAITAVYGGGNLAAYIPNAQTPAHCATVHIFTCENTVQTVYGGGNAADVGIKSKINPEQDSITANTHIIIDGGRFDRIFGGGNGFSSQHNHSDPDGEDYNPGANIYGTATTDINGGLFRQIFGGSNQYGDVTTVALTVDKEGSCGFLLKELFGGANEADITGDVTTTLACGDIAIGSFYGGSNKADIINGSVTLNVYGGTYINVFGGSKGTSDTAANIDGDVTLNLYGGTIDSAFGGCNVNGNITGKITVNVLDDESMDGSTPTCPLILHNVYGGGRNAAYTPTYTPTAPETKRISPVVNLINGSVTKKDGGNGTDGNVFGGALGANATVTANPKVNIGYDTSMSELLTAINHPKKDTPNSLSAVVAGNVYGGGDLGKVAGSTEVNIKHANSRASSLFGGGNQASVGNATVNVLGGNVTTGVYGGCNTSGSVGGEINEYTFTYNSTTKEYSHTEKNNATDYDGIIAVNIKSDLGSVSGETVTRLTEGIYGGGKGQATRTTGDVTVSIGEEGTPVICADVYGGSALGWVGDGEGNDSVKVNFHNGTLHGNLYGGGMGQVGDDSIAAQVKGAVQVNINGGSIKGGTTGPGVYGGCNYNGTVSGAIAVNVKSGTIGIDTNHTANVHGGGYGSLTASNNAVTMTIGDGSSTPTIYGDVYGGSALGNINADVNQLTKVWLKSGTINGSLYGGGLGDKDHEALVNGNVQVLVDGGSVKNTVFGCNNVNGTPKGTVKVTINSTDATVVNEGVKTYALKGVYGGGNQAHYRPATITKDYPRVTINGCNSSIEDVFGGGKAAGVSQTYVVINGGDIKRAFAGGDGNNSTNTPAHVGYDNTAADPTTATSTYATPDEDNGVGIASIQVLGGTIEQVFGGSNKNGVIRTASAVAVDKSTDDGACDMIIGEVYGGGNEAAGSVGSLTIGCTGEWTANHANRNSTGNRIGYELEGIGAVYGGANKADIASNITVDINSGIVENVFGGNNTSGRISGTITVNIEKNDTASCQEHWYVGNVYGGGNLAAYSSPTTATNYPQVNIKNGKVSGDVFGGGLGSSARVTGNPVVNLQGGSVDGKLFGGGSAAPVTGNPKVNASYGSAPIVHGGGLGATATVTGDPAVEVNQTSGKTLTVTSVFGGGDAAPVEGNTTVSLTVGTLTKAFGGGNVADVTGTTRVTLQGATVDSLFGGGNAASVSDTARVTLTSGTVNKGLYGGCDASGSVGDVVMTLTGGTVGADGTPANVFGGGYGHNTSTTGNIGVTLGNTTVYGDLYGGSAFGSVNGSTDDTTTLTINGNGLHGTLYGGGEGSGTDDDHHAASLGNVLINYNSVNNNLVGLYGGANVNGSVAGDITLNVNANVGTENDFIDIFGGGLGHATSTDGNVTVTVGDGSNPTIYGDIYGGSSLGEVGADGKTAKVDIQNGTIHGTLYGGGKGSDSEAATVSGNAEVAVVHGTIHGTIIDGTLKGAVFGGCNLKGTVIGTSTVEINSTVNANVYGGGLGENTNVQGSVVVTVGAGSEIDGDVYGGSAKGLVNCTFSESTPGATSGATTTVTLEEGTVAGDLYGGGHGLNDKYANVWGPVMVTVEGGSVDSVFGCNNLKGAPQNIDTVKITGGTINYVLGGGNVADYAGEAVVVVSGGTVNYGVFGGGNAASVGSTHVIINDGVIGPRDNSRTLSNKGVYGGCNTSGEVGGPIVVDVLGGTFGSQADIDEEKYFNIFGGGYGSATSTTGNVTVNYGADNGTASATPKVYGDLYGGSALGSVNANASNTTTVNILNGSFGYKKLIINQADNIWSQYGGNIYGGGLGKKNDPDSGQVNGVVHVNVGSATSPCDTTTYKGLADLYECSVYGCNNAGGSPQSDVYVDVYKTKHTKVIENNTIVKYNDSISGDDFAIGSIYGGGNEANYNPPAPTGGKHTTKTGAKAHVFIHGCYNTAEFVYGGGNAADAVGVMVEVEGGHFGDVFGGGNGLVSPANIGAGGSGFFIQAGHLNYRYEGCNMQGTIADSVKYKPTRPDGYYCDCGDSLIVDTWFFGGNEAEVYDGLNDTIYCKDAAKYNYKYVYAGSRHASVYGDVTLVVEGGNIQNLFGGSRGYNIKPAHIRKYPTDQQLLDDTNQYLQDPENNKLKYSAGLRKWMREHSGQFTPGDGGNIYLTVKGGKIGDIYGGCDINGNVEGVITINIEMADSLINSCPLSIDNIYGGSNLAKYEPVESSITSPIINLKNGTIGRDDLYEKTPTEVHGCVFGGGMGSNRYINDGVVTCNPKVYMDPKHWNESYDVWVKGNIYGGGYLASVGNFTRVDTAYRNNVDHDAVLNSVLSCAPSTGHSTVEIRGGKVGPATLKMPDFRGHVFGGGKGVVNDSTETPNINFINTTEVTISGSAFVKGSVYGGSENGHVLDSTYVKIEGGQIGCGWNPSGEGSDINRIYSTDEWSSNSLYECNSWPYTSPYAPYDKFAQANYKYDNATTDTTYGGLPTGSDGHTFYGNVFGGGSGYFPYKPGTWLKSAGVVYGNTRVKITGGHILTSVYGGNELTDVEGTATVIMEGGTLGVPRTEEQIAAHPVTCYLFGGGKGDQRLFFNEWTYVDSAYVEVKGGRIYGSVFGGAEDGHVNGNVKVKIGEDEGKTTRIGTRGKSYVDGNIFGGGRGFSGEALTEGVVAGNIDVEITGGTMLGSIYGGGRLASVGTYLVPGNNSNYGKLQPGNDHGHITVNISGGTIGNNDVSNTAHSGNVFGGSMGRLEKLGSTDKNPHWPGLAYAKQTKVTVSGGTIQKNVYGGGEIGFVKDSAIVNIYGGEVLGTVYGGGYGSDDVEAFAHDSVTSERPASMLTAAFLAGRVYGHTVVNDTAGTVSGDIYGGGEMAIVGDSRDTTSGNTTVNIGYVEETHYKGSATIGGNVYGANNIAGSPFGNTRVNIYGTAHTTTPDNNTVAGDKYAIANVFGGGHLAHYTPQNGITNSAKRAIIYVYGCDNTIGSLFGGGDAAAVYGAKDTIDGGRFHFIFGGGNGESAPADIGLGGTGLVVQGGIIDSLFGGSNKQGSINGPVNTVLNHNSGCEEQIGIFFAGSNEADINQSLVTNINCGVASIDEIYGGCHLANVSNDVTLNIKGGTFTRVFAGSKGKAGNNAADSVAANISGDVTLNLSGGTIGTAFAGSNVYGNIGGQITVNVEDTGSCPLQLTQLYGGGKNAAYTPTNSSLASPKVNVKHGTILGDINGGGFGATAIVTANPVVTIGDNDENHIAVVVGDVFGGGDQAAVQGTTTVAMLKGKDTVGNIYGGGDQADVSGATTVSILGGTVKNDVYGGGALSKTGSTQVTLNGGTVTGDLYGGGKGDSTGYGGSQNIAANVNGQVKVTVTSGTVKKNVYGCNNLNGRPMDTVNVLINGGTVEQNVYGGGNLAHTYKENYDPSTAIRSIVTVSSGRARKVFGGGHAAHVGFSAVNINGGTIDKGVYGGCDSIGTVFFNDTVNLKGGQIGATGSLANRADGVFGGGLGAGTSVVGHVCVNLTGSTVYGDLYGGSALGKVNTYGETNTSVNILGGTIVGDVYGGGLGQKTGVNDATSDIAADVYGKVFVTVGTAVGNNYSGNATISSYDDNGVALVSAYRTGTPKGGSVYGCNNINGSPKDNVLVKIYGLAAVDEASYSDSVSGNYTQEKFILDQVFGGGNKSNYSPEAGKMIETHIYGCYNNTIRRVFGGSNAAHATRVKLIIDGGRFGDVFAGGNGEVSQANVTDYLFLGRHGGKFGSFTDHGNMLSSVPTGANYVTDLDGDSCGTTNVYDMFCGNNAGSNTGNIVRTITCGENVKVKNLYGGCNKGHQNGNIDVIVEGGEIDNVFGGCKGTTSTPANVYGYINLTIKGGTIKNVYGGCDVNGNVTGKITVNILDKEDGSCPLNLTNVYGGGHNAHYAPTTVGAYPEVNIQHIKNGKSIAGNVYGGGFGTGAYVISNPVVNIGEATTGHIATVSGKVYGGGENAEVQGNTTVNIRRYNTQTGTVYGGGNKANVTGNVDVTIGTHDSVSGPTIHGDVYGGGALAHTGTSGNTTSEYHNKVTLESGTVGGNIYGGGLGKEDSAAYVYGPVQVIVNGGTVDSVFGCNNIKGAPKSTVAVDVYGTGSKIDAVFGGGDLAAASVAPAVTVHKGTSPAIGVVYGGGNAASVKGTNVTVYGGVIDTVFGGGNGRKDTANVNGTSTVNIHGGTIGYVFGGNNSSGNITDTIGVTIKKQAEAGQSLCDMSLGNVYGGGNLAVYAPTESRAVGKDKFSPKVTIKSGTIDGTVYGGGKGTETDVEAGLMKSNPLVDMRGGFVKHSIYGGGELASVGDITFTTTSYTNNSRTTGTGLTKVLIRGGVVGDTNNARMPSTTNPEGDDYGYVFAGGRGEVDSVVYGNANRLAMVDTTYLEISDSALITAAVYGGCENGLVLHSTHVKVSGGQIGTGHYTTKEGNTVTHHWDAAYTKEQWAAAKNAVTSGTMGSYINNNPFHECDHFPYGVTEGEETVYKVYDIYAGDGSYHPAEASKIASNGHSFYGNVFGGGSGFYPFWDSTDADVTKHKSVWRRTAGRVNGNTLVEITDSAHVLTSIYGGNEITDVLGRCTVKMSGGTLGVPRSLDAITSHPVTCYLFGAGMGDPRADFNTWTSVGSVYVEVSGGIIYGSVFGGGEDGHVKGNVEVKVKENAIIGTWGTSYVDGNVFGGGRGFKGDVLTPGVVAGNVKVDIEGGTMLGSIYGGGRLASVGTSLVDTNNNDYGKMQDGEGHGNITVNVSGGTIGNNYEFEYVEPSTEINSTWRTNHHLPLTEYDANNILYHTKGGNVFGGSMGRMTLLNGSKNPLWSRLAKVKGTKVNVWGNAVIKGSVYGGSEMGTQTANTVVTVSGGTIGTPIKDNNGKTQYHYGSVFGGGYGSDNLTIDNAVDSAGRVFGTTTVYVKDSAEVRNNVFGGGNLASVSGSTTVTVTGGTVGPIDGLHRSGNVYGAGKGKPDEAYKLYSNVASTSVTVSGGSIKGDVYGGGADARVLGNTEVTIASAAQIGTKGLTNYDGNVFGGGRGSGTGSGNAFTLNPTCGRVGGNTSVTMTGGAIQGSIFGGGRMALVGVDVNGNLTGNIQSGSYDSVNHGMATIVVSGGHIGNPDGDSLLECDFSLGDIFGSGKGDGVDSNDVLAGRVMNTKITVSGNARIYGSVFGGGEMAGIGWWDDTASTAHKKGEFYAKTGSATVTINGCDTIGTKREFETSYLADAGDWTDMVNGRLVHSCTGNVLGGSQGDVNPGSSAKPHPHWISMGRSKTATVEIKGGHILGEVFGGAEQGIVTGNTKVTVSGGTIGTVIGTGEDAYNFGSVFGGGYGTDNRSTNNDSTKMALRVSGNVYGNSSVAMTDGTVMGNIYGGGSLASVGTFGFDDNGMANACATGTGIAKVSVSGGTVGTTGVGNGNVYGSSRGNVVATDQNEEDQAWTDSTSVTISGTAKVKGNVFGGGENGHVHRNAAVTISGGTIGVAAADYDTIPAADFPLRGNVYGAGAGTDKYNGNYNPKGGIVLGNTKVTVEGGYISRNVYGAGAMASVGMATIVKKHVTDTFALSWPYEYLHEEGTGDAVVIIKGGHIGTVANLTESGDVYGSARGEAGDRYVFNRLANVRTAKVTVDFTTPSSTAITNETTPVIVGSVYGSGENGHVYDNTKVVIEKGLVGGSVFGGGKGVDTYIDGTNALHSITAGKVYGNTEVTINGGRVNHNVYGGGNMASVGKGNYNGPYESSTKATDTVNTGRCYVNIYGGNIGTDGDENGHVFGASKGFAFVPVDNPSIDYCPDFFMSYVNKTYVTIGKADSANSNPHVFGSVFGGSENGHVRYDAYVQVNRGQIGVELTVADSSAFAAHCPDCTIKQLAAFFADTLSKAPWAYRGNVFGAGRGMGTYKDVNNQDQYNPTSGSVTRHTRVDVNGGTVHRLVYGGGSLASVGQDMGYTVDTSLCMVNINTNLGGPKYKDYDYGGYVGGASRGLASPDGTDFKYKDFAVCENTQVNILSGAKDLRQSIYGGGEFGRVTGRAQVNLNGGKVNTIYCGGKGAWGETAGCENDSVAGSVGSTELNLNGGEVKFVYGGGRRALVLGDATVNVGKLEGGDYKGNTKFTAKGAVYGCNRYKGSPKGDVYVNVYKTFHNAQGSASYTASDAGFAIPKVFGGGAEADYEPQAGKQIYLTVFNCGNTIDSLFGGGDAASVQKTTTVINGGRFGRVFAGGNGAKKAADVKDSAVITVKAGKIGQLFGGSNQRGNVAHAKVIINSDNVGPDCPEEIDEYFGGSNEADLTGNIETTIECGTKFGSVYGGSNKADIKGDVTLNINGGEFKNVYGGSKGATDPGEGARQGERDTAAANIDGNVKLNIYGGKIGKAFGGSNINGNITGKIEVNVEWKKSTCDQQLDTVFGGSNLAAYKPTTPGAYPEVNIKNVKNSTIKDVFGGGKGVTATVTSHPKVTIGDLAVDTHRVTVTNVFGGGDLADVEGTATVLVQKTNSRVNYVYGGGNADTVGGTQVFVTGGTIDALFGGGRGDNTPGQEKKAKVKGNDTVIITGGKIGKAFAGSNLNGDITGRMYLSVNKSTDSLFIGEVYGGGNHAAGPAGTITIGCTGKLETPTTGKRHGYELEGISVVYGGANEADIGAVNYSSNITLIINDGVVDTVFGGNNQSGTIYGKSQVIINQAGTATDACGRYIGYVFGGGNKASHGDTTEVNIQAGTISHHVFGGGNKAGVARGKVTMEGGTVMEDIYGGSNDEGTVTHGSRVTLTGGTVGTVYGGGLGSQTKVKGGAKVDISGDTHVTKDVYGGGNRGTVEDGTDVKIH